MMVGDTSFPSGWGSYSKRLSSASYPRMLHPFYRWTREKWGRGGRSSTWGHPIPGFQQHFLVYGMHKG